jgi:hypothetical protein
MAKMRKAAKWASGRKNSLIWSAKLLPHFIQIPFSERPRTLIPPSFPHFREGRAANPSMYQSLLDFNQLSIDYYLFPG